MMYLKRVSLLLLFLAALVMAQTDTTPPIVVSTEPANGETGINAVPTIIVTFDDPVATPVPASGIDSASISMTLSYGSSTYDVTGDLEFLSVPGTLPSVRFIPYSPFPPSTIIHVTLAFADLAGNWADYGFHFMTEAYEPGDDVCPPFAAVWLPTAECIEPLSVLTVQIQDPISDVCPDPSDVNHESVQMFVNGTNVTPHITITDSSPHEATVSYAPTTGFTPGGVLRVCVTGQDNAGNGFEDCWNYYVCSDDPTDICPPVVVEWLPEGDCAMPTDFPGVVIADVIDAVECPYPTGIDPETIIFMVDGTVIIPSITPEGPYGYYIEWTHPGAVLLEGHDYLLCIEFSDYAGHHVTACETISVCVVDPADSCRPTIEWGHADSCVTPEHTFYMEITDISEICPDSRVDVESVMLWHAGTNITSSAIITDRTHDVLVQWTPPEPLTPGSEFRLCLDAEDFAGNHREQCHEWAICEATPEDDCPPTGTWALTPARCITHGTSIVAEIGDVTSGGCVASGMNDTTVGVWLNGTNVTAHADIDIRTSDIRIAYSPDWTTYLPGDSFHICIEAADNAGLWWEDCVVYHICPDTIVWEDLCPPTVLEWYPLHDTCITPSSYIGVLVSENYDSACILESGLVESSIRFYVNDMNVTYDCLIMPEGDARHVNWLHDRLEPGTYRFCVTAHDFAGNEMEECVTRTVCGDVVTDTLPPVIHERHPGEACLPRGESIRYLLMDESTIDGPTVEVWVNDADVTDAATIGSGSFIGSVLVTYVPEATIYEPGGSIWFCIVAADIFGNVLEECDSIRFCPADTTEPEDICAPRIFWAWSDTMGCIPAEHPIVLEVDDLSPECEYHTGVDAESITLTIGDVNVTSYFDIDVRDRDVRIEHSAATPFASGTTFELCIDVMDFADNNTHVCRTYTICPDDTIPPDTTDTCPPVIGFGPSHERCIESDATLVSEIGDNVDECTVHSGVDPESITVTMDGVDVTDWYSVTVAPAEVRISAEDHPEFTPGSSFVLCVEASDFAGNVGERCVTYIVCSDDTLLDECPPYLAEWIVDGCLEPGAPFAALIGDAFTDACPDPSGINPESIVFTQIHGDVTDEFTFSIEPSGPYGYRLGFEVWGGATPGEIFRACLTFSDFAGHSVTACETFHICPEDTFPPDTSDTTPPCVTATWPASGDTLPLELIDREGLCFHLSDLCVPGTVSSGIDRSSIAITVDGVTYTFSELITSSDPMTGELYACIPAFTHDWTVGGHEAQIVISDNAGNSTTETIVFWIIDDDPEDIDPPCYSWPIEAGDTVTAVHTLSIDICDLCGDEPSATGVDPETIAILIEHAGVSHSISDFGIEANRCMGYTVTIAGSLGLEDGAYTLCIESADFAGNVSEECIEFFISSGYVPPEDFSAPCGEWSFDSGDTLEIHGAVNIEICDLCGDTASGVTGVDVETMTLTLGPCYGAAEPVPSDWITVTPIFCAGIAVHVVPADGWDIGCNQLCISVEDGAGNVYEECHEFYIAHDVPPIDTMPPCASDFYPAEDRPLPEPVYHPGLTLCDICEPGRIGTGVDPASITMTISGEPVDIRHEALSDCLGFDVWYPGSLTVGEYTICVSAMDFAGNAMEACWTFEVSDVDTVYPDIYPPCTDTPFWAGDTIRSDMEIGVVFCDLCEPHIPHDASGVDPASFEITVGACGTTGRRLTEREYTLAEVDCAGYGVAIHPDGGFDPGCNIVCITVSDYAGNTFEDCWELYVEETVHGEFELISPSCGDHVSCRDIPVIFTVPTPLPEDFEFSIGDHHYDIYSPEVELHGDTVVFTPAAPWTEGRKYLTIDDIHCFFIVDNRAPSINLIEPYIGSAIPADIELIRISIEDILSEVDPGSILVLFDGTPLTLDAPGVTWREHRVIINIAEAGLTLEAGIEYELCVTAGDIIDICESNIGEACWTLTIDAPATSAFYIAGYVVDNETDEPLAGIVVSLGHDRSSPGAPMMIFDETVTDAEGYFEFVAFPGEFMAGTMDPDMDYADEFWEESRSPFEATPIIINLDSPETTWIAFTLEAEGPAMLFTVTGTISIEGDGPLAGAHVVAISSDEDEEEWGMVHDMTDSLGYYMMDLPAGDYYFLAHRMGFMPSYYGGGDSWREDAEIITVDGDIDGIDIELPPAMPDSGRFRLHITVMEEDTVEGAFYTMASDSFFPTEPINGARVTIRNVTNNSSYAGITDAEGNAVFSNLPAGNYEVEADKFPFNQASGPITIALPPEEMSETVYLRRTAESITEGDIELPEDFMVGVYPNPFNSTTNVYFNIEEAQRTWMRVIDVSGRIVISSDLGILNAGSHVVPITADKIDSGVYIVDVTTQSGKAGATTMIFVK